MELSLKEMNYIIVPHGELACFLMRLFSFCERSHFQTGLEVGQILGVAALTESVDIDA